MKVRYLSTALISPTVTLGAIRGYLSAEPVTKTNLGTSDTPAGDPISIVTVGRTSLMVAPDTVGFTVDLSASTFDTPAPASSTDYDWQFHELEYYWTFDDPGIWTAPESTLPAWKNRNFAYGKNVRHCYRTAGTKTITVMVVEPSSGKVATASTTVTIEDPDVVFAGDKTICVNPVGDSDFSAKPTGAQEINQNSLIEGDTATIAIYAKSQDTTRNRVRVLFKAGWAGVVRWDISDLRNVTFGTYGGSEKAEFHVDYATEVKSGLGYRHFYAQAAGSHLTDPPDFRFHNIRFKGDFDPTTESVSESGMVFGSFMYLVTDRRVVIVDCQFTGLQQVLSYQVNSDPSDPIYPVVTHLDNSIVENFGGAIDGSGYTFYMAISRNAVADSHMAITGCRIAMDSNSLTEFDDMRALVRTMGHDTYHLRGNDMFNNGGTQSCGRLFDREVEGVARATIHNNTFEGTGIEVLILSGNNAGRPAPNTNKPPRIHALLDSNVFVGGWRTKDALKAEACGITIRNNLIFNPDVPTVINQARSLIMVYNEGGQPYFVDWPIRIYNNTLVSPRSPANNNGTSVKAFYFLNGASEVAASVLGIVEANNVIHLPNIDAPETAFAPLSTDVLSAARNQGFRPIYHEISKTLGAAVLNGGSYTVAYDGATEYLEAGSARHVLDRSGVGLVGRAQFTLSYGLTDVTVTNQSGTTWPIGSVMILRLYNAPDHYRAKDTAYATGNVPSFAPLEGSDALGAALAGPASERTILGQVRPIYSSMGAWEMP